MALVWDHKTQEPFCPCRLSPVASKPSREGNPVPTASLMPGYRILEAAWLFGGALPFGVLCFRYLFAWGGQARVDVVWACGVLFLGHGPWYHGPSSWGYFGSSASFCCLWSLTGSALPRLSAPYSHFPPVARLEGSWRC